MSLKQQIDVDVKQAMLAGDKVLTTTLRGLKSAILYAEVSAGKREDGLTDAEVVDLLTKESKKRQESADLYVKGGNTEAASAELAEKEVIAKYLPEQLSDEALDALVTQTVADTGATSMQDMGKVIGIIKQKAGASADGARVAKIVKGKLTT